MSATKFHSHTKQQATITLVAQINALPDDGVTVAPKHVGAVLM